MDIDTLLLPISASNPCGDSLLHDPLLDDIASARLEDDPTLPLGVWSSKPKKANWKEVAHLCEMALTKRSKDLQLAVWLGEAWIALEGMAGGVRAVALLDGLREHYWDGLHPLPRPDDFSYRLEPLRWADTHWTQAVLQRLPLISGKGPEAPSYTLLQWNEAMALENAELKQKHTVKAAAANGVPTAALLLSAAAAMPLATLEQSLAGVLAWSAALADLHAALATLVPTPVTRLSRFDDALSKVADVLNQCLEQHPDYVAAAAAAPAAPPEEAGAAPPAAAAPPRLVIDNRKQAYQQLDQLADYLAQIEPHSPVPALIRRAVLWGELSYEALTRELMHNNGEIQKLILRPHAE